MKPEEINALAAVAQAVLALATLVISLAISWFVYRGTKRIAKAEHDRSIREWWNTLDTIALSNDEMLKVADELMNPLLATQSMDEKRRRWFAFVVLNALSSSYVGAKTGMTQSSNDTIEIVKHHLRNLLSSDDIFKLTQYGYEKDFAVLCKEIHDEAANQSAIHAKATPVEPVSAQPTEILNTDTQRFSPPSTKIV